MFKMWILIQILIKDKGDGYLNLIVFLLLGACSYTDIRKRMISMKILFLFLICGLIQILIFKSQIKFIDSLSGILMGLILLIFSN